MPRYAFEPQVPACSVAECDRQAMSSNTRICRMHYMRRWRAAHPGYQRRWNGAHPEKVAEYRARYNAKRKG
jgi:hypothetical protein